MKLSLIKYSRLKTTFYLRLSDLMSARLRVNIINLSSVFTWKYEKMGTKIKFWYIVILAYWPLERDLMDLILRVNELRYNLTVFAAGNTCLITQTKLRNSFGEKCEAETKVRDCVIGKGSKTRKRGSL